MNLRSMSDIDLRNKRVLIREDLNVPIFDGIITSDQRLQAALPTLRAALEGVLRNATPCNLSQIIWLHI